MYRSGRVLILLIVTISLSYSNSFIQELKSRISEGEYEEAIYLLEEKARYESLTKEELLLLARAKVGIGQLSEAESIVRALLKDSPEDPELLLMLSELMMERGKLKESLSLLQRLPSSPRRNYLIGIGYLNLGSDELSKSYFARVWEDTEEAVFLRWIEQSRSPVSGSVQFFAGYDSNPAVAPQVDFIAKKESASYGAKGIFSIDRTRTVIKTMLSFTKYTSVKDFDTFRGILIGKHFLKEFFFPFKADYVTLGGDFYRWTGELGAGVVFKEATFNVAVGYQNYYKNIIPEENRDGTKVHADITYTFIDTKWYVKPSFETGYENTKGSNWKNYYFYPYADAGYKAGRLVFALDGGIALYNYVRENSLFGKKRRDTFINVRSRVRIRLWRFVVSELSYRYSQNYSNIDLYKYKRHEIYAGFGGVF